MPDHAGADPEAQDAASSEPAPDSALYVALNPDLAAAFGAGLIRDAAEHWRDCGMRETAAGARPALFDQALAAGRPAVSRAPTLAAGHYLAMNPDLLAAFGADEDAAVRHWTEHGSLEGRIAAGDAPYRDRAPDLAGLLARPFGVDLYLPADETSLAGSAGRRLLASLRDAHIPAAPRPFVEKDDLPLLSEAEAGRDGTFRVSLIVASPQTLRRLLRIYQHGHFDRSWVVAFWPVATLAAHMPDRPTFGAVDEVWVPSEAMRDRMASVAPVRVRHVKLTASVLPSSRQARHRLGLPAGLFTVLLDGSMVSDGQGGTTLAGHVAPAIAAFRDAFGSDRRCLLIVRAESRAIAQAQAAISGLTNALVLGEQRLGHASLLLAASDAMIASEGLAIDQLDTRSDGRAVIEPDAPDLAAALRGARVPRQAQARAGPAAGEQIRTILSDLGLDVPAPAFARSIGHSRHACVPVPNRPPGRSWSPRMPVLSILIDASSMAEPELDQIAQGLAAQIYPFWELCVAGSGRAIDRGVLAADPRLRLVAGRADTAAAAITRAASVATGTHVIVARSAAEASAVSGSLAALAACLEQNAEVAVLLAAETSGAGDFADRIEAGGPGVRPVAFRRDAFVAAGGLRPQDGAAAEYRLLLAILAARRPIGRCLPADAPVRDADGPAAEEAGRLALQAHLTATRGPLAYVEQGLRPFTYRRRTHLMHRSVPAVIRVSAGGLPAWTQADLASEHLVFIENGVVPAAHAIAALLELLAEEEISTAGGRVRRREGTLHHAGLHVTPDGRLRWPGRGRPDDPGRGEAELYVVHNPPAVGGGVLATRRSVLLQLGGFDRALGDLEGATFDLLAADYCLRCGADFGLRTTYTPFAMFERIDDRPAWRTRTPAETLFAARWRVKPGRS